MRLDGSFDTSAMPEQLAALAGSPQVLADVPQFSDLQADDDGSLRTWFHPRTSLGRISLWTTVTAGALTDGQLAVTVEAHRGNHAVHVVLELTLAASAGGSAVSGTAVTWTAEVLVGGVMASVGQRVGAEVARRAIQDVLVASADAAAATAAPQP